MTPLERFQHAAKLPDSFGPALPYARLMYRDESGQAGADADVEYREADAGSRVVVTVSDWVLIDGRLQRNPQVLRVEFAAEGGNVVTGVFDEEGADEEQVLNLLLHAITGMLLAGDGEAGAQ